MEGNTQIDGFRDDETELRVSTLMHIQSFVLASRKDHELFPTIITERQFVWHGREVP